MFTQSKKLIQVAVVIALLVFPVSAFAARYVVVVDPGHGGDDTGVKLSKNVYEKDITLAIAKRIKRNLSGSGDIEARLTRIRDENVSPAKRSTFSEKSNADLFISLQINAGFGLDAKGYEVYYPTTGVPSPLKSNSGEIVKDMEQTKRLNSCVLFGRIVQKNMGRVFSRQGRGLISAPLMVLQSITAPAVLLEMNFATNLETKKRLKEEETQEAIANAVTRSIKKYFSTEGS